jgi:hypothetical protein
MQDGKLIAHLTPEEFMRSTQPEVLDYIRAFHRGERNQSKSNSKARS